MRQVCIRIDGGCGLAWWAKSPQQLLRGCYTLNGPSLMRVCLIRRGECVTWWRGLFADTLDSFLQQWDNVSSTTNFVRSENKKRHYDSFKRDTTH